ncbi:MAG: ORF6N domain-containing protein [bacterium]
MSQVIKFENLQDRIIELRGQRVLLDCDVAELYGVATRDVNKAVANNQGKFPEGYVVELTRHEKEGLVENFHRFGRLKHSTVNPKAFPEKGLYMLATILKSSKAFQATLAIIETFTQIRELSKNIRDLPMVQDKTAQKALMQKSGELIAGILDDDLRTSDTETSIELNFAVLKFKHTIKKKKDP